MSPAVRTYSLSALSSLTSTTEAQMLDTQNGGSYPPLTLNDSIWDSDPLYVSAFAAEPKGVPSSDGEGPFPEFRPEGDGRWYRNRQQAHRDVSAARQRTPSSQQPAPQQATPQKASDLIAPLIDQFADAVTRELGDRLKAALRANLDASNLETLVARTSAKKNDDSPGGGDNDDDSAAGSTTPLQLPQDHRGWPREQPRRGGAQKVFPPSSDDFPRYEGAEVAAEMDEMRQTVANMVMRLSTLEGRQRALQGKMAKLDSAWGGDASQMSLAIAELQHVVASGGPHHAEFGSLRGQLIALAHSIDKLDKRTSTVERRLVPAVPPVSVDVNASSKQQQRSPADGGPKKPLGHHHHQSHHH
eukprot:CAMPEP_0198646604 /NCGR_PEP_ID=MMETSP1467-20131203/2029_1 /TAXON_ID=1462469 /ORGANISM="unid. sp., Strain CCMP2135" /LENGTH=357 /DNA_ID=CAMNT_0044382153 /DNA_START=24 /DNA_END=1097 /DNA_ORIENTATION=+